MKATVASDRSKREQSGGIYSATFAGNSIAIDTEVDVAVYALNRMLELRRPISVRIA